MHLLNRLAAASAVLAASLAMASSAGAVVVGISAPTPASAAGADVLGDAFTTTAGISWQMAQQAFNAGALTYGDGLPMATMFRFTINNGVNNGVDVDPTKTFFTDVTTGQTWTAAFFDAGPTPNQRVEFTAPGSTVISPNDQFKVSVGFVAPVDLQRYTWALMIGGFGLAGVSLRRRRAATLTA
jgi:opacity protein-like surface antigen